MINKEDIVSVYSGENHRCCCGCSGKHYYSSSVKRQGIEIRGYALSDDDINDRMITKIVNLMNKHPEKLEHESSHYYSLQSDNGKRIYLAYLKKQ